MVCKVYSLSSSEDGEIRYIGQTETSLSRRLASHLNHARNTDSQTYVHRWIRGVLNNGHKVQIALIEDDATINESEIEWIAHHRSIGTRLTNLSFGGDRGVLGLKRSEETRQKMRIPKPEATRMKMRKPKAEETRRKMSLAQRGNTKGQGDKNGNAKLTAADVKVIKQRLTEGASCADLGREYGVLRGAIHKIKSGRSWCHV